MHVQFAELPVFDQERAKAFYTGKLGCRVVADAPMGDDGWRWIELGLPGATTSLHFIRRGDETPSPEPVMVLVDDDVAGTVAALRAEGVEIVAEPQEAP
ncbi:VOC family protein, partial [Nocardiopsis tropica]|nr:VOC family protein [Nocardiopsis tropica]